MQVFQKDGYLVYSCVKCSRKSTGQITAKKIKIILIEPNTPHICLGIYDYAMNLYKAQIFNYMQCVQSSVEPNNYIYIHLKDLINSVPSCICICVCALRRIPYCPGRKTGYNGQWVSIGFCWLSRSVNEERLFNYAHIKIVYATTT